MKNYIIISFLFFVLGIQLNAQNPGGVPTAPTLWYRADVATTLTLSGANVNQWKNYKNPSAANQTLVATTYNAYGTGSFSSGNRSTNFFPIVNFVADNGMHTPVGQDPLALPAGTNYAMFLGSRMERQATGAGNSMIMFTNPANNDIRPGLGNIVSGGVTGVEHRQFGVCGLTDNNLNKNLSTQYTSVISGAKTSTTTYTSNSGSEQSAAQNYNCVIEQQLRMGRATINANNNWGGVQEFIVFTGTTLTATQRRQVETYLAIRQGVTLVGSYYSETGSIVWNGGTVYQNRVFGLAKQSAIDVKVSNSVEQLSTDNSNRLIVSTTNDFTNLQNHTSRKSFTNTGSYVLFGDNGATGQSAGVDPCTGDAVNGLVNNNRIWKVQSTGTPDPVWLNINLSHTNIIGDVKMIVSSNSTFTSNVQIVSAVAYASKIATFNYKFTSGVKYIKFIGSSIAAECLGCSYSGIQTLNYTTSTWPAGSKVRTFNLGALTVTDSITLASPAQWYSTKFPQASTGGSLKLRRKGSGSSILKSKLDLNIPSLASFEIYDLDNYYKRYDNVQVYGICNGAIVYPKINYKIAASKSSYIINKSSSSAKGISSSLYNYDKGKMLVSFDKAVQSIIITQVIEGANTDKDQQLGIGPISFSCPNPPPSNPDGVTIQKSAPSSVPLCSNVPYKFRIKNDNCTSRTISLSDILPSNMLYVANSLTFSDSTINSNAIVSNYAGLNNLSVTFDLNGNNSVDINIQAKFTASAVVGNYSNQATITYIGESGSNVTYSSCDMYLTDCQPTVVAATAATPTPLPTVSVSHTGDAPGTCGTLGTTYTVTLNNLTSGLASGLEFEVNLADGQLVDPNSGLFFSSGITYTEIDPIVVSNNQSFIISGLNLTTINANHTITFTVINNTINPTPYSSFVLSDDPANACASNNFIETIYPTKSCPTCEEGLGYFNMKNNWMIGNARLNNVMPNEYVIGNPISGVLKAIANVNYPLASGVSIEYNPSFYPSVNGKWTQLSRYDKLSGINSKVLYGIKFKDSINSSIAAKSSFQIAGMTKVNGKSDIVAVKGYCGSKVVLPRLLYAYNSTPAKNLLYRRFVIDSSTATASGIKSNYDNTDYATMNVEFEIPVDSIAIEWSMNNLYNRKTLSYLYLSDISAICEKSPIPNPDNVHIITSVNADSIPICEEALVKLNIKNYNCNSKTINISNTLPSGISYVDSSYVGLGSEVPSYSNQNFSLNNLVVPSGESYIYIKVKSTNVASNSYSTFYNYTVVGGTNTPNPYSSDLLSSADGYQPLVLKFYNTPMITPKPILTITSNKGCYEYNGDTVLYTIDIKNNTSSTITDVDLIVKFENQNYLDGISGSPLGGTIELLDSTNIVIRSMSLPVGTSTIPYRLIVNNMDSVKSISNYAYITISPTSACASSNTINNVIVLDTAFFKLGLNSGVTKETNLGFTTLKIHQENGWPWNIPNGWIAMHSKSKGFVITRSVSSSILNPIEGMIIYDTNDKCIKLYNGILWKCIQRQCKE